ncbi:aminoacyl-tRNA hydrolase [Blastopirellula marina]|uniref:Peptidyl-tRNA hydrolase n=1 Tax=Blastopirellula marina TaxID=124 RepID=A0A2S8GJB4_9BACT|nr:aminoacyl-tRNA hydrolase [Blastopirellula marina]PQO44543.1 aminoacyl-tRNA hydrolase [Blastopirellula marina]
MKLVVGLGNPGKKYEGTRHNVGFEVIQTLSKRHAGGAFKSKFNGQLTEIGAGGQKLMLLCPLTYMNRSGNSVRPAFDFYKLTLEDVLIVCDDFNLPLAKLRLKGKGSAGGQNGLADVIQKLGSDEVPRLRVGIGTPREGVDVANYVLSNFAKAEKPEVDLCVERAASAVEDWASQGLTYAMNLYNA